jgi:hypothetical protein
MAYITRRCGTALRRLARPVRRLAPAILVLAILAPGVGAGVGSIAAPIAKSGSAAPVATSAPASPAPLVAASRQLPGTPIGPTRKRSMTLREMGSWPAIELHGVDQSAWVPLTVRFDEVVLRARLHLRFTFSPSLLPELSQLKVLVEDQPLASLRLPRERLGSPQEAVIDLDPRYFTEYAKLRFQFLGHYTTDCEFPSHTSLWASIAPDSVLELETRPLALREELGLLPVPFFDARDGRRLELPFVLSAAPSLETVRSASLVASWFGALARWRGASLPALLDPFAARATRPGPGHLVVLATNDDRPSGLPLPRVEVPTIAIAQVPGDPASKMLLVLGRDAEQLRTAAEALVLGQATLSGPVVEVRTVRLPAPAAAWQSPTLVPTGGKVRVGDLVSGPGELRTDSPFDPVHLNLRLPADLFQWESQGMPVDLRFRFTPPRSPAQANLVVRLNDEFVQSFPLRPAEGEGGARNLVLPFLEDGGTPARESFTVPAFHLGANNQLSFRFDIPAQDDGRCRAVISGSQAAIDPDSAIDLTHVEHYAAMPNLALFANSGFPFTKFADLGQTALVLADRPSAEEIGTALTAMGALGAATGSPATRVTLLGASQVAQAGDRDLLVIAAGDAPAPLQAWSRTLPALVGEGQRASSVLGRLSDTGAEWFRGSPRHLAPRDGWLEITAHGPIAAIEGFESPQKPGRSVVVLTASDVRSLPALAASLIDPGKVRAMRGDLVLERAGVVESYRVGDIYYVGELRWWRWIWFQLHTHPVLLSLLGLLLGVALALIVFRALRAMAQRRLALPS